MSEQPTPATSANVEPAAPATANETPNVNELTNSLNAARRREAEAAKALKETADRLNALEAQQKEREEKELSELDLAKKRTGELEADIERLKEYENRWSNYEKTQEELVEKSKDGLTDEQTALVDALPLDKRMAAINQFKVTPANQQPGSPAVKSGKIQGIPTREDLNALRDTYGTSSPEWREAYAKVRTAKGWK